MTQAPFDYDALDTATREFVLQSTGEIKLLMKRSAQDLIDIGARLIDVKERLGHGNFGPWLDAEFDWTYSTALNFMRVAERFKSANFADLNIAPSALYLLASPSTPEPARAAVIEAAQAGQRITVENARRAISEHQNQHLPPQEEPASISRLEGEVWSWLRRQYPDLGNMLTVATGLKTQKDSYQPLWNQLVESLPHHNRGTLIQAINNVHEQVRQAQQRELDRQEALAAAGNPWSVLKSVPRVEPQDRRDAGKTFDSEPAAPIVHTTELIAEPFGVATVGRVTINQGDARDAEKHAGRGEVHLVVTSPPYNTGESASDEAGVIQYDNHSDTMDKQAFELMIEQSLRQCLYALAPGGRLCINVPFGMGRNPWRPMVSRIYRYLDYAGFSLLGQIIWDKGTSGNSTAWGSWRSPSGPSLRDTCEAVIVARKPGDLQIPDEALEYEIDGRMVSPWLDRDTFMRLAQDHWAIPPESAARIGHPAPFPVGLAENLIRLYGWPGCHILDPFAGSGTVAVAALGLPRGDQCRVTLIEQSARYCRLARERVERAAAKAGQGALV